MIDHIDIPKDGASAVYGSDAVAGVQHSLLHKFAGSRSRQLRKHEFGSIQRHGRVEAWIKAGTGDDKTRSWLLPT
jgi:hypothetical protein